MEKRKYLSTAELAKILGISRVAVYKKIKKGVIKAIRVGRAFAIPREYLEKYFPYYKIKKLTRLQKKQLEEGIKKTIHDYGEVLRRLGKE